jgi:intracellular multiplication protein IcmL
LNAPLASTASARSVSSASAGGASYSSTGADSDDGSTSGGGSDTEPDPAGAYGAVCDETYDSNNGQVFDANSGWTCNAANGRTDAMNYDQAYANNGQPYDSNNGQAYAANNGQTSNSTNGEASGATGGSIGDSTDCSADDAADDRADGLTDDSADGSSDAFGASCDGARGAADNQSSAAPSGGGGGSGGGKDGGDRREKSPEPCGAELVTGSRNWYVRQNVGLFKCLLISLSCLLLSLGGNVWQHVNAPEPRYFGLTKDLRLLEMPPLHEPVVDTQALSNWTVGVVTRSLSLNFLTWRRTLSEAREDFDPSGFDSFLNSLNAGGQLEKIENERLSLSCVIDGAPVVVSSGLKNGVMTWRLELPLTLSYESSSGVAAVQKLLAEALVQRAKTTVNPRGLVIRQIILSKAG